ncbi:hypothetical protein RB195_018504 [Necator americanus]|uniref:Uncharacterized protein n=1 Tax=Necator americanus TaxID=51031 RepID=A0ABR1CB61_NECAM
MQGSKQWKTSETVLLYKKGDPQDIATIAQSAYCHVQALYKDMEALGNQGIPTQYIKVLRELYINFTTAILREYHHRREEKGPTGEKFDAFRVPLETEKISSRSPSRNILMVFVFHAKGETTGRLWHAMGTNGKITGARSAGSKNNGSQGGQGILEKMCPDVVPTAICNNLSLALSQRFGVVGLSSWNLFCALSVSMHFLPADGDALSLFFL